MSVSRFMSLEKAAQALETDERDVLALVAEEKLRCGVLSKWYGQAMPKGGGKWHGGVVEYHPNGSRESRFHYTGADTSESFYVRGGLISQFWFLHHSDAYRLATSSADGIEVEFLEPEDGAKLHASDPERFPWPDFSIWLETAEGTQDESRRITRSDLLFRRVDLLKQLETENDRYATTSTGGRTFVTDMHVLANRAAQVFWEAPDRDNPPDNPTVTKWLTSRGMGKTMAEAVTTMIRPNWAPKGRLPKK